MKTTTTTTKKKKKKKKKTTKLPMPPQHPQVVPCSSNVLFLSNNKNAPSLSYLQGDSQQEQQAQQEQEQQLTTEQSTTEQSTTEQSTTEQSTTLSQSASSRYLSEFDMQVTTECSSSYIRNNKAGGLKNVRCFPQCMTRGHNKHGFCGRGIDIVVTGPETTRYVAYGHFALSVQQDPVTPVVQEPAVHCNVLKTEHLNETTETTTPSAAASPSVSITPPAYPFPSPVMSSGSSLSSPQLPSSLSASSSSSSVMSVALQRHYMFTPSFLYSKESIAMLTKSSDDHSKPLYLAAYARDGNSNAILSGVHNEQDKKTKTQFTFSPSSWHYGWRSSKHMKDRTHVFRVFIFELSEESRDIVRCVGHAESTPFTLASSKRSKSKAHTLRSLTASKVGNKNKKSKTTPKNKKKNSTQSTTMTKTLTTTVVSGMETLQSKWESKAQALNSAASGLIDLLGRSVDTSSRSLSINSMPTFSNGNTSSSSTDFTSGNSSSGNSSSGNSSSGNSSSGNSSSGNSSSGNNSSGNNSGRYLFAITSSGGDSSSGNSSERDREEISSNKSFSPKKKRKRHQGLPSSTATSARHRPRRKRKSQDGREQEKQDQAQDQLEAVRGLLSMIRK